MKVMSHVARQRLVDEVIEEMKRDIANNDWTAIEALLWNVNPDVLTEFLPEEGNALVDNWFNHELVEEIKP